MSRFAAGGEHDIDGPVGSSHADPIRDDEPRDPAVAESALRESALIFSASYPVRFGQCDPAGIAFFPRLIEMVSWVVEDWFGSALDASFRDVHIARRHGIPAASIAVDFVGPAQLGDVVAFKLQVEEIGRSSVRLRIDAGTDRGPVLSSGYTIVYCDLSAEKPRPIPVPEPLRGRMARYLVAG